MSESLEDLIKRYISLGKQTAQGFFQVKCARCSDHKVRGGFKFENDNVVFHCFNCSTTAVYDPTKSRFKVSKNLREVLLAFGIPEAEINAATSQGFFNPKASAERVAKPVTSLPVTEAPLPPGSKLLATGYDYGIWGEIAREYLSTRMLDPSYPYYIVDAGVDGARKFIGRLIIPYSFRGKIIYWQARAMDDSIEPKYKNPVVEKNNIFFNMDELYRYTSEPLFVTEGPLDALSIGINTIALTGSTLNEFKLTELKKAAKNRPVIFVIDKNLPGYKLGHKVLQHENMSIVVFPNNVDDANDALRKLGRLWLTTYLSTNAVNGFKAKVDLEISSINYGN